ncbi:MAG: hypothetical protein COB30_020665, partial [Ectothiorhodospiraceae bacterium]|nr:hypothetical protein [Ectothiorhodospiraceae bacterium]
MASALWRASHDLPSFAPLTEVESDAVEDDDEYTPYKTVPFSWHRPAIFSGEKNTMNPSRLPSLLFALLFGLALSLGCFTSAFAAMYTANPSNYVGVVGGLVAGDTLTLDPGTYTNGLYIDGKNGTASQPIVIIGPTSGDPAVFTPRADNNTVQIKGSSYVEIRHLTVDGQNAEVDGVNSKGNSHHITIANLHIINHGADQQIIGISTKGPTWDWVIEDNVIEGAGTGMYLGNSDGSEPFVNGLIQRNLIVDTIGYNIEIKHQTFRPTGVGLPTGVSRTIIRDNVFTKATNYSEGSLARPNLLVGHFPPSGAGLNDVYEIYGNFFYQNPSEALFQGEGNIAMYNNVMVNDFGDALNIQPHNDVPKKIRIFHNTIVASSSGIKVNGGDAASTQRVFGNVVYAGNTVRVSGGVSDKFDNITGAYSAASDNLTAPTAALGSLDLFPLSGKSTGSVMDLSLIAEFTDSNLDFDGRAFRNTDRGAYVDDGAGAAWLPRLQIKASTGPVLPYISLSASSYLVTSGANATLNWSVSDATTCTASGDWSGNKPLSGSTSTGAITVSSTYTLTCTGDGGDQVRAVTINVEGAIGGGLTSELFDSVTVEDSANAGNWSIQNDLQVLDIFYGDRSYTVSTIPADLVGADWIKTANDSKSFSGNPVASFNALVDIKVTVAHRSDIATLPDWLSVSSGWTFTGSALTNSEPQTYDLFSQTFISGSTVNLGANGGSGQGMYLVVVQPAEDGGVITPPV